MAVDLWVMERAGFQWARAAFVDAAPLQTVQPRDEAHMLELTQNEVIVSAPDGAVI